MTKKQKIIIAVILSILAIAILVFYMTRTDDNKNDEANNTQEQEADLYDLEGDDSLDLIDLALAEGEIDRETAL
ncbi:MAG: hypothetical protein KAT05_14050, partial [Spirochaetes bacterium]|nr:hypothetical protein [Spirochaetota bacterium]